MTSKSPKPEKERKPRTLVDVDQFLDDLEANGLTIVPKDEVKPGKDKAELAADDAEIADEFVEDGSAASLIKSLDDGNGTDDVDYDNDNNENPDDTTDTDDTADNNDDDDDDNSDMVFLANEGAGLLQGYASTPIVWSRYCNGIEFYSQVHYDGEYYWINDNPFKEGDMAFVMLRRNLDLGCNLDTDYPVGSLFDPIYLPADPTAFFHPDRYDVFGEYHAPGLADEDARQREPFPEERDLIRALEAATLFPAPGYFLFCRGGRFGIICSGHHNPVDYDFDNLVVIFNAAGCSDGYRKTWCTLNAEAHSTKITTEIRYVPFSHWFWPDVVVKELVNYALREDERDDDCYYGN